MVTAFFYGTLMHPEILKRVIGNDGTELEICPALLLVSLLSKGVYHFDTALPGLHETPGQGEWWQSLKLPILQ